MNPDELAESGARETMAEFCLSLTRRATCGATAAVLIHLPAEPGAMVLDFAVGGHLDGFSGDHVPDLVRELVPGPGMGGKIWKDREFCSLYLDPGMALLARQFVPARGATLYLSYVPTMTLAALIVAAGVARVVFVFPRQDKASSALEYLGNVLPEGALAYLDL